MNYSSIYTSALLLEQKFIVSFPVLTTEKGGPLNQTVELLAKRNGKPERIIQYWLIRPIGHSTAVNGW